MELLLEFGLVIIITTIISGLVALLRQPLIIGYILSGIIIGPSVLGILQSTGSIDIFSHMGIAFLLFIVGLNLSPKVIKEVGKVSAITGIGQVIFTSIIGFAICIALGFIAIEALYIAIAITFSSTIIIMKILIDREDVNTLYGKIAIGFLIVQDLIAMIFLMIISAIPHGTGVMDIITGTLLRGLGLLTVLFIVSIYFLPNITKQIAKSQEYLFLFSISWCLAIASIFHIMGFSMEVGALIAGITLALSPYRFEISARMRPLRDFFLILFFIVLGSQMTFANLGSHTLTIIILSIFILIGNPLIIQRR